MAHAESPGCRVYYKIMNYSGYHLTGNTNVLKWPGLSTAQPALLKRLFMTSGNTFATSCCRFKWPWQYKLQPNELEIRSQGGGFLQHCLCHLNRNKASFPHPGSVSWRSWFQQKCKIWSTYWHVWGRRQCHYCCLLNNAATQRLIQTPAYSKMSNQNT